MIAKILSPALIPIASIDKTIRSHSNHYSASFTCVVDETNACIIERGRTGKFVPANGGWREIAKGRFADVEADFATGEIYAKNKKSLIEALEELTADDLLEVDRFGLSGSMTSAMNEVSFEEGVRNAGFSLKRCPADMAKHLGEYTHYDYTVTKLATNEKRRVEVKSLWGTDTRRARLIHSKGETHETSSCKFVAQDIFAVGLFLRTGNIADFAFARSVPANLAAYGLPHCATYPEYVHQNPLCQIGDGVWFADIESVWNLA